jgi:hypothetical protein
MPFTDEVRCAATTSTAQASPEKRQVSLEPIQVRCVRDTPTHFLSASKPLDVHSLSGGIRRFV